MIRFKVKGMHWWFLKYTTGEKFSLHPPRRNGNSHQSGREEVRIGQMKNIYKFWSQENLQLAI